MHGADVPAHEVREPQVDNPAITKRSRKNTRIGDIHWHPTGQAFLFWGKYKKSGDINDLNTSIFFIEESLDVLPKEKYSLKPYVICNLAASLKHWYQRSGDHTNLERAISLEQEATKLVPEGVSIESRILDTLGHSLALRFELSGKTVDIDIAVSLQQQSVANTPGDHTIPRRPRSSS